MLLSVFIKGFLYICTLNKKIMLKLMKGLLVLSLLFFNSCMDHDLATLSSDVDLDYGLAIPLIHSTTTLGDLLPENENMLTDDDGLIRIAFRQDSIAEILSDSLMVIEDQEPTVQDFTVGAIELPDFETNMLVVMSDLTSNLEDALLSAQITTAIDNSQSFGSAYFPAIEPQSGGVYTAQGSTEFQSVLITDGSLNISITNNLAIALTVLELRLSNATDDSEIGVFVFDNIQSGTSSSASIQMDNVVLYSNLKMEIVNLSSPGTGSNPLDQSSWVSISNDDYLVIDIQGEDLITSQGMVKFPAQTGPDSTFVVNMDFEDGAVIDFIDLAAGQFVYSFDSDLNTTLELTLEIPQLLDENGNSFSELIQIVNTGLVTTSIPLANYKFDFSDGANQLHVNYSSQILASQNYVSYDESNEISLSIGMEDIEFELIQGYFGQLNELIEEDILDLDFSALTDIALGILLESPSFIFTTDNSFGIPFEIDIDLIGESDEEMVNLNGPVFEIAAEEITTSSFTSSNSQLPELIAINPSTITYSGSVISNPLGNIGIPNTLRPNTNITFGFEMDLPFHLRIEDATTKDTLDLGFDSENNFDMIESVKMQLHVSNEFPLDVELTMFFQDSISGIVLDSLVVDLLQAAAVDETGKTIAPSVYDSHVSINADQFEAMLNANQTILDIRMNSYDSDNFAIKLYTDYEFIIDAGVIIELKIEE